MTTRAGTAGPVPGHASRRPRHAGQQHGNGHADREPAAALALVEWPLGADNQNGIAGSFLR